MRVARVGPGRIGHLLVGGVLVMASGQAPLAQTPSAPGPQDAPKLTVPLKVSPPVVLPKPLPVPLPPPAAAPGAAPCPDPALRRLTFRVVERTPGRRHVGKVSLIATVENVGKGEYRSRSNQQTVDLYETVPGRAPRRVAGREFATLAPGQRFDLVWTRAWDASSPAEGEFPPSFEARLAYDPDIRIDGNPANDECTTKNNAARLNGKSINEALRGG